MIDFDRVFMSTPTKSVGRARWMFCVATSLPIHICRYVFRELVCLLWTFSP